MAHFTKYLFQKKKHYTKIFMYLLVPFIMENFKFLIAYPPFFLILSTSPPPLSCHLQQPPQMFFLLPCFFGWMGDHATFDVLFCLGTLVPWDVFYTTRRQVYGGLTHCGFLLVLWFDIKHTHTKHTQRPVDWYTHINIYLHHLLCAHSSYLYYIKWLNI